MKNRFIALTAVDDNEKVFLCINYIVCIENVDRLINSSEVPCTHISTVNGGVHVKERHEEVIKLINNLEE